MWIATVVGAWVSVMAADGVVLRAGLTQGQELRYDIAARLEARTTAGAEVLEQSMRLRLTVASVDRDGAKVHGRLESLKARSEGPGREAEEFAWVRGDPAGPEQDAPLAATCRAMAVMVFEVTVDPSGEILGIAGLERIGDEVHGVEKVGRLMGVLAPEAAGRMLQPVFAVDASGKARNAGDSWTERRKIATGVWRSTATTEWRMVAVEGGNARIEGAMTIQPDPTDDTRPLAEVVSQATTITAEWDAAASRLVRRVMEGAITWRATVPLKEPIVAESLSKSKVEFRLVE